jgi:tetratricopeptide (TPR) repeat protein
MKSSTFLRKIFHCFALAMLLSAGLAMAQSEPSMNQIYATAKEGKLDAAQVMIQQVLVAHPNSGKAHFVRAELYSRQGKLDLARESLASAERLSPGLKFATPESLTSLRTQIAGTAAPKAAAQNVNTTRPSAPSAAAPAAPTPTKSWALPLLLAGGVIVAAFFFFKRRDQAAQNQAPGYVGGGNSQSNFPQNGFSSNPGLQTGFPQNNTQVNGLSGVQTFGNGPQNGYPQPGNFQGNPQGNYPQGNYPQGGYPQQPGSGMGGRIMGGVATGLAVGAGLMAAQAIGKSLTGEQAPAAPAAAADNNYQAGNSNQNMGGENFGINDSSSWDDGGGDFGGGGGDWDS